MSYHNMNAELKRKRGGKRIHVPRITIRRLHDQKEKQLLWWERAKAVMLR